MFIVIRLKFIFFPAVGAYKRFVITVNRNVSFTIPSFAEFLLTNHTSVVFCVSIMNNVDMIKEGP